jgi:glycosyltransferase involved in cell wall biosynthesis
MEECKKILFLATEDAPGMRPYAFSMIRSTSNPLSHAIIVLKQESEKKHFNGIEQYCKVHYLLRPSNTLGKLWWHVYPKSIVSTINSILDANDIDLIVTLTGEVCLSWIFGKLQKKVPILHTVHDAIPHEYKLSFINSIKDKIFVSGPNKSILKKGKFLVTNSTAQKKWLEQNCPDKKIYYCPFPSLVTADIENGAVVASELNGINDYILFFGRIEFYKGVHLLYNAYINNKDTFKPHRLVLAGRGDHENYYFPVANDNDVIVLNRFIEDCEVRKLFENAAVVVYPYISATQSGVLSIASRFGKKMVVSDVPFFRDSANGQEGVFFTDPNNEAQLVETILDAMKSTSTTHQLYAGAYSLEAITEYMDSIINNILS